MRRRGRYSSTEFVADLRIKDGMPEQAPVSSFLFHELSKGIILLNYGGTREPKCCTTNCEEKRCEVKDFPAERKGYLKRILRAKRNKFELRWEVGKCPCNYGHKQDPEV